MDAGSIKENPHLRWIVASIRAYRAGELDALGLAMNISAESSAIEGDVPRPVREAIEQLADDLDFAYWATGRRDEIERVLERAEEVIARHYPRITAPDTA